MPRLAKHPAAGRFELLLLLLLDESANHLATLATLATLGSLLPALRLLFLSESSGSAGLDGVPRLAEGLVAGAL